MAKTLRGLPTILVGMLLVAVMFTAYTATQADATHEPANKTAAAGSDVDEVEDDTVILSETMKVSTTHDLIMNLSAECSILTSLLTGEETGGDDENTDSAFAFGSVRLRLEIDGQNVPVASDDLVTANGGDEAADTDNEPGEVTFCNRAHQRTVTDTEDDDDGLDTQDDFIRTRSANSFQWLALNVGVDDTTEDHTAADAFDGYDNPAIAGNNVVVIEVIADFDESSSCGGNPVADNSPTALTETCAEAWVGSRTLIVEPTNASIHELVNAQGGAGN